MEAEALFADNSLVVARLRIDGSITLIISANCARGAEREAFVRESWTMLLSTIAVLLRRLESNTLLPGTIREEELDYALHQQTAIFKAKNELFPSAAVLRAWASMMGYDTLLDAMLCGLDLLPLPYWPGAQKRSVQRFVLQGLDVIPLTAGVAHTSAGEAYVVAKIETRMNPHEFDPAFCAAVLCKWQSETVTTVLRSRGVLQAGNATSLQDTAEYDARQRADVAKHGLRDCALPSCFKTEKTVKEFAGCTGCRTVVYCCVEHQVLDWKAHKKVCHETERARLAAEEAAA